MTLTGEWTSYRRLRAPQTDGAHLVDPPLSETDAVVADNRRWLATDYDMQGKSLLALRKQARRDLIAAATRYVRQYTEVSESDLSADAPVIVTGHQPQLFHPGVWLKNFIADDIARKQNGIAVHVVIDADLFGAPSIRVPCGSAGAPRWENVDFDAAAERMPSEERTLVDAERFISFGKRVATAVRPFVEQPLVAEYWPKVLDRSRATENLGSCLAQARHLIERKWGAKTLEMPQSRVCQFDAFRWLTVHVLAQLPQLWRIHNEALHRYRRAHRIRTTAQPLPDLRHEDDWLEAPLWTWHADDPTRRPLWTRPSGKKILIADRHAFEYELDLDCEADGQTAVEQLAALEAIGTKIRPRALLNTFYCRVLLSDLFIHGIGGAKYDQLTDEIIADFMGFHPPMFSVATGTLRLPVDRPAVDQSDAWRLKHELRGLAYHPEKYVDAATRQEPDVARWIEQKQHWANTPQTPTNARERYRAIRASNAALQPAVGELRETLLTRQSQVTEALRADAILGSREWSFCLHPKSRLRKFLLPTA